MKNNFIMISVFINMLLTGIFMGLNSWSLSQGFEETFIFLALAYGLLSTIINAVLVASAFSLPRSKKRA